MMTKLVVTALVGTAVVLVGLSSTRPAEPSVIAVVTATGCLRSGSASTVFLLRGARVEGTEGGARDYLLVSVPSTVELGAALNHQVSIEGDVVAASEGPAPPPAANTVEKALRRLVVRSLTDSGANCS
jgi:hypothetical protein